MRCICEGNLVVYDKMPKNLNRYEKLELNDKYLLANILYQYRLIIMKVKDKRVQEFIYKFVDDRNSYLALIYKILAHKDIDNLLPKFLDGYLYTKKRDDDILVIEPLRSNLTEDEITEEIINNRSSLIENFKISYYYIKEGNGHGRR